MRTSLDWTWIRPFWFGSISVRLNVYRLTIIQLRLEYVEHKLMHFTDNDVLILALKLPFSFISVDISPLVYSSSGRV